VQQGAGYDRALGCCGGTAARTVSGRRSDNPARPERPVEAVGGREGAERRTEPRCGGPQWPCGCSGRQPVTGRRPGGEPIGGPGGTDGAAAGRAGQSFSDSQVGAALRAQQTRRPRPRRTRPGNPPRAPADYVQRARTAGARADMILIRNGDHAMLRRSSLWHRTAATAVTGLLHPDAPPCALTTASYAATDPLLLQRTEPAATPGASTQHLPVKASEIAHKSVGSTARTRTCPKVPGRSDRVLPAADAGVSSRRRSR
jgi:hypothetical protein